MKVIKNNNQVDYWDQFIRNGNMDALSKIYFNYYDLLFTYGLKHTSEKQVVEDAIQDVFMNLIKFRRSIGNVKNSAAYMISAFRRQLFLDLNKQKKTILSEKLPEEQFEYFKGSGEDSSEQESKEQLYLVTKQCIGSLTDKQQEIIYLRFESGISYEEIADMLQISVDSCYKSVYRSIKIVRNKAEKILGKGGNIILCFLSGFAH